MPNIIAFAAKIDTTAALIDGRAAPLLQHAPAQAPRRIYTDDFKAQAVSLSNHVGRTTAARQLDVLIKTLAH